MKNPKNIADKFEQFNNKTASFIQFNQKRQTPIKERLRKNKTAKRCNPQSLTNYSMKYNEWGVVVPRTPLKSQKENDFDKKMDLRKGNIQRICRRSKQSDAAAAAAAVLMPSTSYYYSLEPRKYPYDYEVPFKRQDQKGSFVAFGRSVSKERVYAEERKHLENILPLDRFTFQSSTQILRDPSLNSPQQIKAAVRSLAAGAIQKVPTTVCYPFRQPIYKTEKKTKQLKEQVQDEINSLTKASSIKNNVMMTNSQSKQSEFWQSQEILENHMNMKKRNDQMVRKQMLPPTTTSIKTQRQLDSVLFLPTKTNHPPIISKNLSRNFDRSYSLNTIEDKLNSDQPPYDLWYRETCTPKLPGNADMRKSRLRNYRSSHRFSDLYQFYTTLELIHKLQDSISNINTRVLRKSNSHLNYEDFSKVQYYKMMETKLCNLIEKLKEEQQNKDFLFQTKDINDFKWRKEHDFGLLFKEKSVEDLRENFENKLLLNYNTEKSQKCEKITGENRLRFESSSTTKAKEENLVKPPCLLDESSLSNRLKWKQKTFRYLEYPKNVLLPSHGRKGGGDYSSLNIMEKIKFFEDYKYQNQPAKTIYRARQESSNSEDDDTAIDSQQKQQARNYSKSLPPKPKRKQLILSLTDIYDTFGEKRILRELYGNKMPSAIAAKWKISNLNTFCLHQALLFRSKTMASYPHYLSYLQHVNTGEVKKIQNKFENLHLDCKKCHQLIDTQKRGKLKKVCSDTDLNNYKIAACILNSKYKPSSSSIRYIICKLQSQQTQSTNSKDDKYSQNSRTATANNIKTSVEILDNLNDKKMTSLHKTPSMLQRKKASADLKQTICPPILDGNNCRQTKFIIRKRHNSCIPIVQRLSSNNTKKDKYRKNHRNTLIGEEQRMTKIGGIDSEIFPSSNSYMMDSIDIRNTSLASQNPLQFNKGFYRKLKDAELHRYQSDVNLNFKGNTTEGKIKRTNHNENLTSPLHHCEKIQKIFEEQRHYKYLQEQEEINARRHLDNYTPLQKSPIPLNRYDDFPADLAPKYPNYSKSKGSDYDPNKTAIAVALYTFNGQNSRELSFKKGDIIRIRRSIDSNWCEGEYNAMIGLLPRNYIEILDESKLDFVKQPITTQKIIGGHQARAKYNFQAQTAIELALKKGDIVTITRQIDDNWYEGRVNERKGIFPISYVEIVNNIGRDGGNITIVNNNNNHNYKPLNIDIGSLQPMIYKAIYKYRPQNSDELELLEGDIVDVLEKCDDGWYVGTSQRTGCFGTFPGNYTKPAS